MGYVYEWINKLNGKWYIGSHDGTNPNYTAGGIAINKAFEKYGIDNFLCRKFKCNDYRKQEDDALKRRDAFNDPMSYNMKNSAIGGDTWTGRKHSQSTKNKMSKAKKGIKRKPFSEETKQRMSEAHKGLKKPWVTERNKNNKIWAYS